MLLKLEREISRKMMKIFISGTGCMEYLNTVYCGLYKDKQTMHGKIRCAKVIRKERAIIMQRKLVIMQCSAATKFLTCHLVLRVMIKELFTLLFLAGFFIYHLIASFIKKIKIITAPTKIIQSHTCA